jgi:hypothetical protein
MSLFTTWQLTTLKGGRMEKTENSLSMQCMPRSFAAMTVAIDAAGGSGLPSASSFPPPPPPLPHDMHKMADVIKISNSLIGVLQA